MGRRLILALLALQLLRGLLYMVLVPLWQNPDELGHFEYARLLADHGEVRLELPLHETVAYQVLALLGHRDPPPDRGRSHGDLRRTVVASLERHRFWEIRPHLDRSAPFEYTELGQPPLAYLGAATVLRVLGPGSIERDAYALRILNVLLTVGVIGLACGLGRELFPDRPVLALAPAAFVTFLPQYSALAGSLTNDKPVELIATAVFWLLVRAARRGARGRDAALAAGLVVVGLLTKLTALFLVPLLLSVWDCRRALRRGTTWPRYLATRLGAALALGALFVTAPQWLPALTRLVEAWVAGWPAALRAPVEALGVGIRRLLGDSLTQAVLYRVHYFPPDPVFLRRYFAVLFSGFWGNFGHMEAPMPVALYGALAVASGAALAGLGRLARDTWRGRGLAAWQGDALLILAAGVGWSFLVTFARDAFVNSFSQGRHLFPVLVPVAVLLVVGLRWIVPRLDDPRFGVALVLGLALVDLLGLVLALLPHFYGVALLGGL